MSLLTESVELGRVRLGAAPLRNAGQTPHTKLWCAFESYPCSQF